MTVCALYHTILTYTLLQSYILGAIGITGLAIGARMALRSARRMKGVAGVAGKFVEGGFNQEITRKEAAEILGV